MVQLEPELRRELHPHLAVDDPLELVRVMNEMPQRALLHLRLAEHAHLHRGVSQVPRALHARDRNQSGANGISLQDAKHRIRNHTLQQRIDPLQPIDRHLF